MLDIVPVSRSPVILQISIKTATVLRQDAWEMVLNYGVPA